MTCVQDRVPVTLAHEECLPQPRLSKTGSLPATKSVMTKLQHGRGFRGKNAREAAPLLEVCRLSVTIRTPDAKSLISSPTKTVGT